jgi:threonine dehydratase
VSEREIRAVVHHLFTDTHNVTEGGGAGGRTTGAGGRATGERAGERRVAGKRVAVILSGVNVDRALFARILEG